MENYKAIGKNRPIDVHSKRFGKQNAKYSEKQKNRNEFSELFIFNFHSFVGINIPIVLLSSFRYLLAAFITSSGDTPFGYLRGIFIHKPPIAEQLEQPVFHSLRINGVLFHDERRLDLILCLQDPPPGRKLSFALSISEYSAASTSFNPFRERRLRKEKGRDPY